jgi:sterol desaturase/sphingolipid hydroxylase (fatty acid hydroxylase superfamily)
MTVRSVAEHRENRRRLFWRRMVLHSAIASGVIAVVLAVGMWGYMYYEKLGWRDAFVNAAMLASGMGPIKTDLSDGGKVFAGIYALACGLVVIGIAGLLLAPAVHRVMHKVHWEDRP